jgi:Fe-S-cluster containining protein
VIKPGRNDPCPCGSGKKYKKCCQAKDDARAPALVPALPQAIRAILEATRQAAEGSTRAALVGSPASLPLALCAETVAAIADDTWKTLKGAKELTACKAGCAWCCHTDVSASAPEVFRIAEHVARDHAPEARAALLERLAAYEKRMAGLTDVQRARTLEACPLLVEGRCSVHPVRPLKCRGYNSFSAEACEKNFRDGATVPPVGTAQIAVHDAVLDGHLSGLEGAGHRGEAVNLARALEVALTRPDAKERWLAGEAVLGAGSVTERRARG